MHIIKVTGIPANNAGETKFLSQIMRENRIVGVYDTARLFVGNNQPDAIVNAKLDLLAAIDDMTIGNTIDAETGPEGGETAVNIVGVPGLALKIATAEGSLATCTAYVTLAHSTRPSGGAATILETTWA